MPTERLTRLRGLLSGLTMAAAIAVMNVTTYGLTLLAARVLGPAEFGQFSAVLGLLIIVNVLSLGLQATAARRISAHPEAADRITGEIRRATAIAAVSVLSVGLAASPFITALLGLTSWWSAAMMAVAASLLTVMGGLGGLLQGEQRWRPLGLVYLSMGAARLALGVAALQVSTTTASAMTGVAVAAAVPAAVAWWALRGADDGGRTAPIGAEPANSRAAFDAAPVWREIGHATSALLAFFALSNVDIVLARVVLPDHEAGLYAAGLILTKAVLFLPQFVVIVAFPAMARNHAGRRTHLMGLGVIAGLGAVASLGVATLPALALAFTGGQAYAANVQVNWVFALLGTILAMIQLLVYSALAQAHPRAVRLLWAGLAVMILASATAREGAELLRLKLFIDAGVLLLLLLVLVLRPGRGARTDVAEVHPPLAEDVTSPEQPAVR